MAKINSVRDLPNWYSPEKYEILGKVSKLYLLLQLKFRIDAYRFLDELESRHIGLSIPEALKEEELYDDPFLLTQNIGENVESFFHFIQPMMGRWNPQKKYAYVETPALLRPCYFEEVNRIRPVYVDLENFTDKEILGQFSSYLIEERKKRKISPPQRDVLSDLRIEKIIPYKTIELTDLLIWSRINSKPIAQRILSAALFPYGEVDLKQVARPHLKHFLSFDFGKTEIGAMNALTALDRLN